MALSCKESGVARRKGRVAAAASGGMEWVCTGEIKLGYKREGLSASAGLSGHLKQKADGLLIPNFLQFSFFFSFTVY